MFNGIIYSTVACVVCAAVVSGQQSPSTTATIERLAARAAIERSVGPMPSNFRVVIDPMIVKANEAPGARDLAVRDAARNTHLTRLFGARTAPRDSVIDCGSSPCRLRNADIFLTLAQPVVDGTDAKVTATTVQRTKRGIQYKTVNVLLKRQGNAWKVVGFEDLGIS